MLNKRKKTKAARIRSFIAANPNATARYIADQLGFPIQSVYNVQHKLRNPTVKKPNIVTSVSTSNKSIQEYMDKKAQAEVDKYWNAIGEVQKAALSPERIAELSAQAAKPKSRMMTSDPEVIRDIMGDVPVYEDSHLLVTPKKVAEIKKKLIMEFIPPADPVNNPAHYTEGGIETIDYIEAKRLGYHLGNAVKYISRAGRKGTNQGLEDLKKAQWYLARAIEKNEYASPSR
jgi:hypothetical protein